MSIICRLFIFEAILLHVVLATDEYDNWSRDLVGEKQSSQLTMAEHGQLFQQYLARKGREDHRKNFDEFHEHVEKIPYSTSIILTNDSSKVALFSEKFDQSHSKIVIRFKIWLSPRVKFAICRNMNTIIHNCKTIEGEFEPGQEKQYVYSTTAKIYNEHPARVVYLAMKTSESPYEFFKLTVDKMKSKAVKIDGSAHKKFSLDATPVYQIDNDLDHLMPKFQKYFTDKQELKVYDGKDRICSTLSCDFQSKSKNGLCAYEHAFSEIRFDVQRNIITNDAYLSYICMSQEKCIVGLVSGNYSIKAAKNWTLTFNYQLIGSATLEFITCFHKTNVTEPMALTDPCQNVQLAETFDQETWQNISIPLPKDSYKFTLSAIVQGNKPLEAVEIRIDDLFVAEC